jgi:hypothetical protein
VGLYLAEGRCGEVASLLRWVAEDRRAGDREGTPPRSNSFRFSISFWLWVTLKLAPENEDLLLQTHALIVVVVGACGRNDCILRN